MALATNLVAYYKLDEASGNATDSTGNGHTGTNTSVTFSACKINNGAYVNGSTAKLDIGNVNGTGNTAITFAGWIKVPSGSGTNTDKTIVGYNAWNATGQFTFHVSSLTTGPVHTDNLWLYVYGDSSGDGANLAYMSSTSIVADTWTHVAVTFDSTAKVIKYYINGSLDTTSPTYTTLPALNLSSISLGDWFPGGGDRSLRGYEDEIGIWTRVLSSTEIASLHNSGAGLAYPFTVAGVTFLAQSNRRPNGASMRASNY